MEQVWTAIAAFGVTMSHLLAIAVGLGVFTGCSVWSVPTPPQRRIRALAESATGREVMTLAGIARVGARLPDEPRKMLAPLLGLSNAIVFGVGLTLVAAGFFSPLICRRMPHPMDPPRVAVAASHRFDAALLHVACEHDKFSPPNAPEFPILRLEIRAGVRREKAFNDLGLRTGAARLPPSPTSSWNRPNSARRFPRRWRPVRPRCGAGA